LLRIKDAKGRTYYDTIPVIDSVRIEYHGKPIVIYTDTTIVNEFDIQNLTEAELIDIVKKYYTLHVLRDTLNRTQNNVTINMTIIDTLTNNQIIARNVALDVVRHDTIINTHTNTIVEVPKYTSLSNSIFVSYGVSTVGSLYELNYLRHIGNKKLQWSIGGGAGMSTFVNNQQTFYIKLSTGVTF
jgi:hypothetical protein